MAEPIATLLPSVLDSIVRRNARKRKHSSDSSSIPATSLAAKFVSVQAPGMLIGTYMQRIMEWAPVSPECFIAAFVYVNRIVQKGQIELDECSAHRLVLVSVLIAAKFLEDISVTNSYYASIGGISVRELNQLELSFLKIINFDLSVDEVTWRTYEEYLQKYQQKVERKREKLQTKKGRVQDLSQSAELRLDEAEKRYTIIQIAEKPRGTPLKPLKPPPLSVSAPLPPPLSEPGPVVTAATITRQLNRLWLSAPLPDRKDLSMAEDISPEEQDNLVRAFWAHQTTPPKSPQVDDPMEH